MLDSEKAIELINKEPRLSLMQARLFLLLWESRGRFVSYDRIENYVPVDHARSMSLVSRAALVKRLRATIKEAGWPVVISAKHLVGYRLTAPDGWEPGQVPPFAHG